jgi:spore coat protein CotH
LLAAAGLVFSAAEAYSFRTPRDDPRDPAFADALFTNDVLLHLRIEIPEAGLASLRRDHRKYVKATVREGEMVYTDVAIHLKGSAGSLRGVDDKPGLTLSLMHFEANRKFHGLQKFHLNNSVQDPTCLSERICGDLFRAAGVPACRVAHALVELNGRKLGLFVLKEAFNQDFLARYFKNTRGNMYGLPGGADITDPLERVEGDGPLDRAD